MKDTHRFYIGSYSIPSSWAGSPVGHGVGISVAQINSASGAMLVESEVAEINPSFLAIDSASHRLWATTEPQVGGELLTYSLDTDNEIELLARTSAGADAPCHVEVDVAKELAFVSHYHGHSLAVHALSEGGSSHATPHVISTPAVVGGLDRSDRSARPHSSVRIRDDELVVADTGRHSVVLYRVGNDAKLTLVDSLALPIGTGPRHLAWSEQLQTVYVSNQEGGSVGAIRRSEIDNKVSLVLTRISPARGLGRARPRPSEVAMHPRGDLVYMANRADDSLSVFEIVDTDGRLSLVRSVDGLGSNPRHFSISPSGQFLLIANGGSDEVVSFWLDDGGRSPKWTGQRLEIGTPSSVVFE
ncbi:lactonase family protein [Rhodoglobus aureus]|uniref:lactonase family protein n=1 Tax=Rhodoglobus aureus TaxID=191497 RepID=UPI003CD086AB